MSILTKVFVVLLVVCSMLTSAAVVVFVNKVNVTQAALTSATDKAQTDRKALEAAAVDANAARAAAENQLTAAQGQITVLQKSVDVANGQVSEANVALAKAKNDGAMQLADIGRLTDGLAAAQASNGKMQDTVADLRTSNDKLVKQAADDARAIAEQTNLFEAANKELQFTKEQLQATQEKAGRQALLLQQHGISGDDVAALPPDSNAVPPINGVVREKRDIGGITYVTISVGSADAVRKGMQFYVVDRQLGKFLGIVTIDTVQPNEATGRLEGYPDSVSMVKVGNDVKTSLQ